VALFFLCAAKKKSDKYISITSEGTADIREAGISEASDRAYLDAQRKAIEKALGKLYSAKTVVEAGRFIEQNITSNIKGYIRKWEKIDGPEVRDYPGISEKLVWVKIEAKVGKGKLKEDSLALEEIQRKLGRPDFAVVIDNKYCNQMISSKLKEKQFTVREINNANSNSIETALENNIDIIIDGTVESSGGKKIMPNVDMRSFQANVIVKALNVTDGEILSQASGHGAHPHIEEESGTAEAIRKASTGAIDEIMEQVLSTWEYVLNNGNNIYLKMKGISLLEESDFKVLLKRYLRGLQEVHDKGFNEGVFTYKLKYLGDAKQLAKELSSMKSKVKINVSGYKSNTVEAEVHKEE
jgi:hypothetical protein